MATTTRSVIGPLRRARGRRSRSRSGILAAVPSASKTTGEGDGLQGSELARQIADTLADLQAEAIVLLDISGIAGFADYFVIASALSPRQFDALAEAVTREVPRAGARRPRREGTPDAGWLLLDFGDVIVHLFTPEERAYYGLEQLWGRGKQLLRIE